MRNLLVSGNFNKALSRLIAQVNGDFLSRLVDRIYRSLVTMAILHQSYLALDRTTTRVLREEVAQDYQQLAHDAMMSLCIDGVECVIPSITVNGSPNQTESTSDTEASTSADVTAFTKPVPREASKSKNWWMVTFVSIIVAMLITCICAATVYCARGVLFGLSFRRLISTTDIKPHQATRR